MSADELASAVLAQLRELAVFDYELTRYVPCAATTADSTQHRVLIVDKTLYTKWWGPPENSGLPFVVAATLTSVTRSADALPGGVAEAVGRCQEVRMGATLIRLCLDDDSEVLYEDGIPSFPGLPPGRHVVDAACGEIVDEARLKKVYGLGFAWCLVTNAQSLRSPQA